MAPYDLTELDWQFIHAVLPSKVRGVKRRDDRQVSNGVFYVLRTGCPWRDLPIRYSPSTTVYNRFRRWTEAGICDRIMDARYRLSFTTFASCVHRGHGDARAPDPPPSAA